MENKKVVIELVVSTVVTALLMLWVAEMKVSLKPFSVSFGRGYTALGYCLILIGILLLQFGAKLELLAEHSKELDELNAKAVENIEHSKELLEYIRTRKVKKEKDETN